MEPYLFENSGKELNNVVRTGAKSGGSESNLGYNGYGSPTSGGHTPSLGSNATKFALGDKEAFLGSQRQMLIEPSLSHTRGYAGGSVGGPRESLGPLGPLGPLAQLAQLDPLGSLATLATAGLSAKAPLDQKVGSGSGRGGRGDHHHHNNHPKLQLLLLLVQQQQHPSSSDEDEKFLSLAREALVATANGANSQTGNFMVDPTIQDLLQRLQYASSPHGNPIRDGSEIRTNANGKLMIHDFYNNFPNLNKDIFAPTPESAGEESHRPHANSSSTSDWNFFPTGELLALNDHLQQSNTLHRSHPSHTLHASHASNASTSDPALPGQDSQAALFDGSGDERKFLCSVCAMSFRRSSDLKRHEKQHLSIPPNICELCGKGFARKDALKRHFGTLTCQRNADKKLYVDNLKYLEETQSKSRITS